MQLLNWITNNWVNILAFMGALNVLAQTIKKTSSSKPEGTTAKIGNAMHAVASLGIQTPKKATIKKIEGDDSVIPPSV